jgi:hypothetical protein
MVNKGIMSKIAVLVCFTTIICSDAFSFSFHSRKSVLPVSVTRQWQTPPQQTADETAVSHASIASASTSSHIITQAAHGDSSRGAFIPTHQPLNVRIDDKWLDLGRWRSNHPSGEHWLDLFKDRDATEIFFGFHSAEANKQMLRMPQSKDAAMLDAITPKVTPLTRNFRALRSRLEEEGWWKRDFKHEMRLLGIWGALLIGGIKLSASANKFIKYGLGMMMLAIANTAAGWLGHDYIHGVDKFCFSMRNFGALFAGMSPTWWSDKHNKHHAVTNHKGVDEDLATEPLLYVYPPAPHMDVKNRKFQHIYFPVPLSMLFAVWRFDSLKLVIKDALSGFKRKTVQKKGWDTTKNHGLAERTVHLHKRTL